MQDLSIRRSLSTAECKVKRSHEPVPDHTHVLTSHFRPCTVHTIHSTHRQDINLNNMAFSTVTTFWYHIMPSFGSSSTTLSPLTSSRVMVSTSSSVSPSTLAIFLSGLRPTWWCFTASLSPTGRDEDEEPTRHVDESPVCSPCSTLPNNW